MSTWNVTIPFTDPPLKYALEIPSEVDRLEALDRAEWGRRFVEIAKRETAPALKERIGGWKGSVAAMAVRSMSLRKFCLEMIRRYNAARPSATLSIPEAFAEHPDFVVAEFQKRGLLARVGKCCTTEEVI